MARTKKAKPEQPALYREDFSEDELREAKIVLLESLQTPVYTICTKAGLPMAPWGSGYVLLLGQCWCSDPHVISTEAGCPDAERMQVVGDHVHCPIHGTDYYTRAVLDLAPGKRKCQATRAQLLSKINLHPKLTRAYGFWSGNNFERTAVGIDPKATLREVSPSPTSLLQGCVFEAATLRRCREIFETKADELPKRDLHGLLRDDLSLPADWHGAPLSTREQTTLEDQQWEDARAQRAVRQKEIDRLRRQADRLVIERA